MLSVTSPSERAGTALTRLADEDLAALLLIRHFEEKVLELFGQGRISGTTHTCLGQEYIPVALEPLLAADDVIFSNHRGHGHYLARFRDPEGLLAEIMGREGGVCGGYGGSQHIYRDGFLSTGVQGESLPVAVGVALDLKRSGSSGLAVAYIGDGTWGEGAVYEALNMAQLWRVPLLVVVENNGIAQSTPTALHLAGTIADRARAFGIGHQRVVSADITAIRAQLAHPVAQTRARRSPLVVEFVTHRVGPHSKGDDTRETSVVAEARRQDWYRRYGERFPQQFQPIDRRQRNLIDAVARRVEAQPLCGQEDACSRPSG